MNEKDSKSLNISLNHSNINDEKETGIKKIDNLNLEFEKNNEYVYFDPAILKTIPIKDDNIIIKKNFDELNINNKILCYIKYRNSKRYLLN